jgi:hypothetical protein
VLLARRKDLATPNWGWQVGYRASRDVFYFIEKIAWPVFHFYSASPAGQLPRGQAGAAEIWPQTHQRDGGQVHTEKSRHSPQRHRELREERLKSTWRFPLAIQTSELLFLAKRKPHWSQSEALRPVLRTHFKFEELQENLDRITPVK